MTYEVFGRAPRPVLASSRPGHSTTVLALSAFLAFLFGLIAGTVAGFNAVLHAEVKTREADDADEYDGERVNQ